MKKIAILLLVVTSLLSSCKKENVNPLEDPTNPTSYIYNNWQLIQRETVEGGNTTEIFTYPSTQTTNWDIKRGEVCKEDVVAHLTDCNPATITTNTLSIPFLMENYIIVELKEKNLELQRNISSNTVVYYRFVR